MIEVPHLGGIEAHDSTFCAVHADVDLAIVLDMLDGAEVTVDNLQVPLRSCKLDLVSSSKLALDLAVGRDAAQPCRVIGHLLTVLLSHCDKVLLRVCGDDLSIA